uniref:Putative secreted peptide n=1 Tax=Anopheles braziliensis TaxID=58242 RepID=A0A2M3ZVY8_9DIPT
MALVPAAVSELCIYGMCLSSSSSAAVPNRGRSSWENAVIPGPSIHPEPECFRHASSNMIVIMPKPT